MLVVLDKCHQLVDVQHAAQYRTTPLAEQAYPSYEQLTSLKGAAVRSK